MFLALENHGGLTTKVEGLLRLVNDVKSPWFGVNLDTGNFSVYDLDRISDVYDDIAKMAPYALNVQVKVMIAGSGGKKVPTDYNRLAKILTDAGYRGYIVLEYEEAEDPRQACPRCLDQIRQAFS